MGVISTFSTRVCVSDLGKELQPLATSLPVDVGLSCPQSSQEERGAPTSETPIWWGGSLSSGLQLHSSSWGRGFVNLIHLHLECSALQTPRSLWGRDWIFLVQELLMWDMLICLSVVPSSCLSAPSTFLPAYSSFQP